MCRSYLPSTKGSVVAYDLHTATTLAMSWKWCAESIFTCHTYVMRYVTTIWVIISEFEKTLFKIYTYAWLNKLRILSSLQETCSKYTNRLIHVFYGKHVCILHWVTITQIPIILLLPASALYHLHGNRKRQKSMSVTLKIFLINVTIPIQPANWRNTNQKYTCNYQSGWSFFV